MTRSTPSSPYASPANYVQPCRHTVPATTKKGMRQFAEVIIIKEEVLHGIETELHQIERTRHLEETPIVANDDNRYAVIRDIDAALGKVVERCQAYLLQDAYAHHITTDHTKDWKERTVKLSMPMTWPLSCINPLRDAIHTYIVKSSLLPLLSLTMPGDPYIPIIMQQQQRAYDDINALISTRTVPTNIRPTFLG